MKIEISEEQNGYVVKYTEKTVESIYVYRSVDDLMMIVDIAKKFLKRRIKVVQD